MDEKEKLLQARDHIIAARSILKTSEHPLAKVWLDKLEEVLEAVPKPQPRPADKPRRRANTNAARAQARPQPRPAAAPRKQKKRSGARTLIYMLFFLLVLAGLLFAAVTFLENSDDETATPAPTQTLGNSDVPANDDLGGTPAPSTTGDATAPPTDGETAPSE